jgi:Uma2 family endonuclease
MLTREHAPISEAEYLRLEAQSPVRHEYVNGKMFAMTGTSLRHKVIALKH